jgi:hypothetical protein
MIISFKTLAKQWAFELVKYEVSTYNLYKDQFGLALEYSINIPKTYTSKF